MRHCIETITGKPQNYKLCPVCKWINWYENTECVSCGEPIKRYQKVSKNRIKFLQEEFEDTTIQFDV